MSEKNENQDWLEYLKLADEWLELLKHYENVEAYTGREKNELPYNRTKYQLKHLLAEGQQRFKVDRDLRDFALVPTTDGGFALLQDPDVDGMPVKPEPKFAEFCRTGGGDREKYLVYSFNMSVWEEGDLMRIASYLRELGEDFFIQADNILPAAAGSHSDLLRLSLVVKKNAGVERVEKDERSLLQIRMDCRAFIEESLALGLMDIVVPGDLALGVPCDCIRHMSAPYGNAESGRRAYKLYADWEKDSGGVKDKMILVQRGFDGLVHRACGTGYSPDSVRQMRLRGVEALEQRPKGPYQQRWEDHYGPGGTWEEGKDKDHSSPDADEAQDASEGSGFGSEFNDFVVEPIPESSGKKWGCGA